jgi:hypothetical protein
MRAMATDMPNAARRAPTTRLLTWTLLAGAVIHVWATRESWRDAPLQNDAGLFSYIGWRLNQGGRLYADLWEVKPPGIYYVFAACAAFDEPGGDRVAFGLDGAVSLAVLAVGFGLARRFRRPAPAALAVLAGSFVIGHRVLADWGDNCEKFVALFEGLGLLACVRGACDGRRSAWWCAGVCAGLGGLFKQTAIVLPIAIAVGLLIEAMRGRRGRRAGLADFGMVVVGCATVWLPVIGWMGATGILRPFAWQVLGYEMLRVGSPSVEGGRLLTFGHWKHVVDQIGLCGVLLMPAALGLGVLIRERVRSGAPDSKAAPDVPRETGVLIIGLSAVLTVVLFVATPHGYGHYLLQAVPAGIALAAAAFESASDARRRGGWTALPVACAALTVIGLLALSDHFGFTFNQGALRQVRDGYAARRAQMLGMAAFIQAQTPPEATVMIWPVDFAQSYYAQRRSPLEWSNADVVHKSRAYRLDPPRDEFMARLRDDPPDLIVERTMLMPDAPKLIARGVSLPSEANDDARFEEGRMLAPMKRWIDSHYEAWRSLGDLRFAVRKAE